MAQPIWVTPSGTLGTYPSSLLISTTVSATPVTPAVTITYALLSGVLAPGLSINSSGNISGIPDPVIQVTSSTFTIRATDDLGNIRDRTFSITISGSTSPKFTTPEGGLLSISDSIWVEMQVEYTNPNASNPVTVSLISGLLPPGLGITETGIIHGYCEKPIANITKPYTQATVTGTSSGTNILTCTSTSYFAAGRPIVFSGSMFGLLIASTTFYVKSVINSTSFTISATDGGPTSIMSDGTGSVTATLEAVEVGNPIITTHTFTLGIDSPAGTDLASYSITVINQNTPVTQGGPGASPNTRRPAILNTRPRVLSTDSDPYYGYYIYPAAGSNFSHQPLSGANIGTIRSDNFFAFKVIGHDFDSNTLSYVFSDLPPGLVGDANTGWITGTPILSGAGISQFSFGAAVYKSINPGIQSEFYNFTYKLTNEIDGIITWTTPSNLGTIQNGLESTKRITATSDVDILYRIVSGSLPPNLTLLESGEITGKVVNQPTALLLEEDALTTFTFTAQAYSPEFQIVTSDQTFTLTIEQSNAEPLDTVYIKATPSIQGRNIIANLLTDDTLIPPAALYRKMDPTFGKATEVVYNHAYGIPASDIQTYLAAVTKNHYGRSIILGDLETAVAKDENGEIIYEVVYSKVIDDLINPTGTSVSKSLYWPRLIDLGQGPWYTSSTLLYTSYATILDQDYYTSLSPGYARSLYPNSLPNMRTQIEDELGHITTSSILPLWMTSQQNNGSTLGYTQAWVICYTLPGQAETIKDNINASWQQPTGAPYSLNMIDFTIDRFFVDKRLTYNFNSLTQPGSWTGLPSTMPPDPQNSKDFYVLFPQTNILPNESQY